MPTDNEFAEINWELGKRYACGGLSEFESKNHKDSSFIWLKLGVHAQVVNYFSSISYKKFVTTEK